MHYRLEISFVKVLMPFMIGIVAAYNLQSKQFLSISVAMLAILIVGLLITNKCYNLYNLYRHKHFISTAFYLLFFFFGATVTLAHTDFLKDDYFGNKDLQQLKVIINEEPQQINDIIRFVAKVTGGRKGSETLTVNGNLLVALKVDTLHPVPLKYGDELWISAKCTEIEPPYNPAEFDFKAWLASKSIYHQTFVNQSHIVLIYHHKANPIMDFAINLRQRQVEIYRKIIKDNEAFAVASTLILGYRADLSKETLSAYSKTGTIHALSVSGMHVGLIYLILNWSLAFFDRNRALKLVKFLLIISLIWYYSLITGLSPSVLRSAIMLSAFMVSKLVKRKQNSYNVISFTALCILAYDPFLLLDVGFQLSFLAVLGLIYLQPKIYRWIYIKNNWADKLWQTVAMSLSAQLATYPLSIYYFHQFPVYFLLANLFIFLPVTGIMYLGLFILITKAYFLAPLFEWVIIFVNGGLKWISTLPLAGITAIWISPFQMVLLSIAIFLFIYSMEKHRRKLLWLSLTIYIGYQSIALYQADVVERQSKIIFFSLRKNYASAFINGRKSVVMTDLNSNDKTFEFFVKPALDQMQVNEIKFIKWDEEYSNGSFSKQNHQIKFKKYHALLYSDSLKQKTLVNKPKFDIVLLHQTSKLSLKGFVTDVQFKTLIIDASNKDYHIEKYKSSAKNLNLEAVVLKKNPALIINLNP